MNWMKFPKEFFQEQVKKKRDFNYVTAAYLLSFKLEQY